MREDEYPEFTEPEHIIQDAMEHLKKFKKLHSMLIVFEYDDDDDEGCFSHFNYGSHTAMIGMCEAVKKFTLDKMDL